MQPCEALEIKLLGCLQESDSLQGKTAIGVEYVAVTLVADQGAICRLEGKATVLVHRVVAGETAIQYGLIAGRAQQAEMKQRGNLERRFSTIYCIQQPEDQAENFWIPILLSGETNDQFTGKHGCYVAFMVGTQGEKRVFQFSFAEKKEPSVSGWTVGDSKQGKLFKLIDKTLFRALCPFGNGSYPA